MHTCSWVEVMRKEGEGNLHPAHSVWSSVRLPWAYDSFLMRSQWVWVVRGEVREDRGTKWTPERCPDL